MKQLRITVVAFLISISSNIYAKPKAHPIAPTTKGLSQQALLVELTGKDLSRESDISLYAEMVSSYQRDNEITFKSCLQNLLKRFPQSPYADNALLLAGRMAVNHANYAEAIRYFSQIEKNYSHSNRLVSAKYAKAMTYKRMNLPEFATPILKEVRARYPGSPESFRADAELKISK